MATIRFRHPLVRSALYHAAAPSARRAAHSALAVALDERDPEAAAWHRAAAATGPDAGAADALEETGDRSADRGASAASSAAYEASARLSTGEPERVRRLSLAGRQAWLAGQIARARGAGRRARRLRATRTGYAPSFSTSAGRSSSSRDGRRSRTGCCSRPRRLAALRDPTRAALMLGEAADACLHLDDRAYDATITALDALVLPAGGLGEFRRQMAIQPERVALRVGFASRPTHAPPSQMVEREAIELRSPVDLIWAGRAHWILGEYGACVRFGEAAVAGARESAPGLLPEALRLVATSSRAMGRWNAASTAASEGVELARALGQGMTHCALAALLAAIAAARGQAAACHGHAEEAIRLADELGLGVYRLRAERALALLALGSGRLDEAIDALTPNRSGGRRLREPRVLHLAGARPDRSARPRRPGGRCAADPARPGGCHVARGRRGGDRRPLPGAARRGRLRRDLRAIHRQPCEVGQPVRAGAHRAVLRRAPAPGAPPPRGARAAAIGRRDL